MTVINWTFCLWFNYARTVYKEAGSHWSDYHKYDSIHHRFVRPFWTEPSRYPYTHVIIILSRHDKKPKQFILEPGFTPDGFGDAFQDALSELPANRRDAFVR